MKQIMLQLVVIFAVIFGVKLKRSSDVDEQIVGGRPQTIHQLPYQAALYYHGYFFCSGSVITPYHIITAGHCLVFLPENPGLLCARVGTAKLHKGGQLIRAKKFFIHPKYRKHIIDYDVAIVDLTYPMQLCNSVHPLKIANADLPDGTHVVVSGWGFLSEIGPSTANLHSTVVVTISRDECRRNYTQLIPITERMICAAAEGKDACYGDSGGPLVYQDVLVGVVSSGHGCAQRNFAGIYSNIANKEIQGFIVSTTQFTKRKRN